MLTSPTSPPALLLLSSSYISFITDQGERPPLADATRTQLIEKSTGKRVRYYSRGGDQQGTKLTPRQLLVPLSCIVAVHGFPIAPSIQCSCKEYCQISQRRCMNKEKASVLPEHPSTNSGESCSGRLMANGKLVHLSEGREIAEGY